MKTPSRQRAYNVIMLAYLASGAVGLLTFALFLMAEPPPGLLLGVSILAVLQLEEWVAGNAALETMLLFILPLYFATAFMVGLEWLVRTRKRWWR